MESYVRLDLDRNVATPYPMLVSQGLHPTRERLSQAVRYEEIAFLQRWWLSLSEEERDRLSADAASFGSIPVLRFLSGKQHPLNIEDLTLLAAEANRVDVLNWLSEQGYFVEPLEVARGAAFAGNGGLLLQSLEILQASQNDNDHDVFILEEIYGSIAEAACLAGHDNLLDLIQRFSPAPKLVNCLRGAVRGNQYAIAQRLLPNLPPTRLDSFFSEAARSGSLLIAARIRDAALVQDAFLDWSRALEAAAGWGQEAMVVWLLQNTPTTDLDLDNALRAASTGGHLALIQQLHELGATDLDGALLSVVSVLPRSSVEVTRYLLDQGASNLRVALGRLLGDPEYNWTPLSLSAEELRRSQDLLRLLSSRFEPQTTADVNLALAVAAALGDEADLRRYLPEATEVDAALLAACKYREVDAVALLLEAGASTLPVCIENVEDESLRRSFERLQGKRRRLRSR